MYIHVSFGDEGKNTKLTENAALKIQCFVWH